jgi:hypothetical protein
VAIFKTVAKLFGSEEFSGSLVAAFLNSAKVLSNALIRGFQEPVAMLMAGIDTAQTKVKSVVQNWKNANQIIDLHKKIETRENTLKAGLFKPGEEVGIKNQIEDFWKQIQEIELDSNGGPSFQSRVQNILKSGVLGQVSQENITEGKAVVKGALNKLFDKVAEGIKSMKVEDIFGASSVLTKAVAQIQKVSEEGAKEIKASKSPFASHARVATIMDPQANAPEWFKRAQTRAISRANSMTNSLASGGLASGSLGDPARRTTPWLRFRERREFDRARRAGEMAARGGRRAEGDTLIRRGDRRRAKEVIMEREREKQGLEKTNAILTAIQTRFDSLVK